MKISFCLPYSYDFSVLKNAGADGVEFGFATLEKLSESEAQEIRKSLDENGIVAISCNNMFPGDIKVTGESVNYERIDEYLNKCAKIASILGIKNIVFGSCGARALDGNNTKENAYIEMASLLRDHVSPIFRQYGLTCSIEPLSECAVVTTLSDGKKLAKMANCDNIGVLVDYYHFIKNEEDWKELDECENLFHVHIASFTTGRKYPRPTDSDDYTPFVKKLRSIGYDGYISVEGAFHSDGTPESEQITTTANVLKSAINA